MAKYWSLNRGCNRACNYALLPKSALLTNLNCGYLRPGFRQHLDNSPDSSKFDLPAGVGGEIAEPNHRAPRKF